MFLVFIFLSYKILKSREYILMRIFSLSITVRSLPSVIEEENIKLKNVHTFQRYYWLYLTIKKGIKFYRRFYWSEIDV